MRVLPFPIALWLPVLLGGLPFILARIAGGISYAGGPPLAELGPLWRMGLRFDLKLLAVLWLLPWLVSVIVWLGLPRRRAAVLRWLGRYFLVQCGLFNLLAVSNHYYQGYFHSPFNPTVFGLIDDDTWVVLVTIWQDLPVVRIVLGVLVLTVVQWWAWRHVAGVIERTAQGHSRPAILAAAVLMLPVLLLAARGRVDAQPINREDFAVSPTVAVSDLVPNAVFALYYAWKDYRTQTVLSGDPSEALRSFGYASPLEAGRAFGIEAPDEDALLRSLVRRTASSAPTPDRRPHAVIVLFESWGAQTLQRHGPDSDLLGRMARHVEQDYWFPHFTSSRRGTHPTLEAMLINSPVTPLSQGRFGLVDYASAAMRPFKDAGYRTIFMYGGSARWRSMHRAMPHLAFDEVLDLADIMKRYPDASTTDNGAHDEFLYRLANDRLAELDRQEVPAAIFILNTTNHTPYVRQMMPTGYAPVSLNMARFPDAVLPAAEAETALKAFRYTSDALGGMIDAIESQPLGARTMVAATGDHYMRNFFRHDGVVDAAWMDRVGFYLRVPEAYRQGVKFMPQRFGSHRDIFPTLYARALPGAAHFAFGEDLLGGDGAHAGVAVCDFNNVYRDDEVALNLRSPTYYRWDAGRQHLVAEPSPSVAMRDAVRKERARAALQDWVIRLQATGRVKAMPPG
jgi:hypothetical protein